MSEAELWREHSVRLNAVLWRLAVATGRVVPGDREFLLSEGEQEAMLVRVEKALAAYEEDQ